MEKIDLKHTLKDKSLRETLADIGERELLNRLAKFMDIGQIEDDTALIKAVNHDLLINTDVLVEDVHFNVRTSSPADIGWKAITTNLSDLISSGADEFLNVSIALIAPSNTEWKWVEGVYEGIKEALNEFGGKIIGGDCSQGKEKIISITAIGKLGILRLHRSNAIPGDYLISTGNHGLSRLGLALLTSESISNSEQLTSVLKEKGIHTHLRPIPQIKALKSLQKSKPKDLPWRAAGTDSSDGLLDAVESICRSSKCQAVLNECQLPKPKDWPKGSPWNDWCLNGGEDYELIISLPKIWAEKLIYMMPNIKHIGYIKSGKAKVIWENGETIHKKNISNFKHF